MKKLEVPFKVRCIDPHQSGGRLRQNGIYTVIDLNDEDGGYHLQDDTGRIASFGKDGSFCQERFIKTNKTNQPAQNPTINWVEIFSSHSLEAIEVIRQWHHNQFPHRHLLTKMSATSSDEIVLSTNAISEELREIKAFVQGFRLGHP